LARLLLVAFLALAVPTQAAFALSYGQCRALGHHGGGASSLEHTTASPAQRAPSNAAALPGEHDAMSGAHASRGHHYGGTQDAHAHANAAHDAGNVQAAHASEDEPPATGGSGCVPCAGCCASAAISGPSALHLTALTPALPLQLAPQPLLGIRLSPLDRPPLVL
jgi:hypothetical protein